MPMNAVSGKINKVSIFNNCIFNIAYKENVLNIMQISDPYFVQRAD